MLDDALLRPGRFDRIVEVNLPDSNGRFGILCVHLRLKEVPTGDDVTEQSLRRLADRCDGMAGAALEALVNEAAIRAARRGANEVRISDFEDAFRHYGTSRRRAGPNSSSAMHYPWSSH